MSCDEIGRHRPRRRHARELRELVDQPLQRLDLADDRLRALVDERLGGRRRRREMAPQPLGAQLDRRQRILDLVRQPSRHLAPGRDLLRADERRHIVEHQHDAFRRPALADERRRHGRQMDLLPVAGDGNLLRGRLRHGAAGSGEQRRQRLEIGPIEHGQRGLADNRAGQAEQPRRRAVDRRHRAAGIDRHDAGRNALENRLDVAAALLHLEMLPLELDRRSVDLAAARRQLARHRVERVDERAELVVALRLDVLIQAAGADLAGGRREHQHRPRDPLRQIRAHPGRAEQNQQRHHEKERQVQTRSAAAAGPAAGCSSRTPASCGATASRARRSDSRSPRRRPSRARRSIE